MKNFLTNTDLNGIAHINLKKSHLQHLYEIKDPYNDNEVKNLKGKYISVWCEDKHRLLILSFMGYKKTFRFKIKLKKQKDLINQKVNLKFNCYKYNKFKYKYK